MRLVWKSRRDQWPSMRNAHFRFPSVAQKRLLLQLLNAIWNLLIFKSVLPTRPLRFTINSMLRVPEVDHLFQWMSIPRLDLSLTSSPATSFSLQILPQSDISFLELVFNKCAISDFIIEFCVTNSIYSQKSTMKLTSNLNESERKPYRKVSMLQKLNKAVVLEVFLPRPLMYVYTRGIKVDTFWLELEHWRFLHEPDSTWDYWITFQTFGPCIIFVNALHTSRPGA